MLAALLAGAPALGQQRDAPAAQPGERPGTFGEVLEVRVVNLEVVVTDKHGVRISGLGPQDFAILVDGREVPVEYFTEILGGRVLDAGGTKAAGTLPVLAPGEAVGTSYLVFIDEYFSRPEDLDRVLVALHDQLPNLGPGDRMAIVAYDGKTLSMLSTWSQSVETLERAIKRARRRPAHGRLREAELRSYDVIGRAGLDDQFRLRAEELIDTEFDPEETRQVELLTGQVERVVQAASAALRGFGGPPGRKVMLLFSGGWPYDPTTWVANDIRRTVQEGTIAFGYHLYRPLIDTANRLSYTVYPIEVKAFADQPINDPSGVTPSAPERLRQLENVLDREAEEESSLALIARRTGGKALLNDAGNHAFERVVEDTRSYYWLGFTPSWQGDDRSHDVRVQVRRAGLEVRARRGYSDLSRTTEVSMMTESALLFGSPPSDRPLAVELGDGKKSGLGRMILPITVFIPLNELTFLPGAEGYRAQIELRIALLDERGNSLEEIPVVPLELRVAEPPKVAGFASYDAGIKMRRRKHDLVVSLYDKVGGTVFSTRMEVDPR